MSLAEAGATKLLGSLGKNKEMSKGKEMNKKGCGSMKTTGHGSSFTCGETGYFNNVFICDQCLMVEQKQAIDEAREVIFLVDNNHHCHPKIELKLRAWLDKYPKEEK